MISKPDGKGGLEVGGIRYMMIRPDAMMGLFKGWARRTAILPCMRWQIRSLNMVASRRQAMLAEAMMPPYS